MYLNTSNITGEMHIQSP